MARSDFYTTPRVTLDNRYVNVTGDTMTGALTVPTIYGSSADNGDITIEGTSSATKTTSYVILQPTSGNVGIGTTAPVASLDVVGANDISAKPQLWLRQATGGLYGTMAYLDATALAGGHQWRLFSSAGTAAEGQGKFIISDGTTAMLTVLPTTGNVGIGTTGPDYKLNVRATDSEDNNNTTTNSQLAIQETSATHGIYLRTKGSNAGISGLTYANQIIFNGGNAAEIYTLSAMPLVFGTGTSEKMRIDTSGNVGIGTTGPRNALEIGKYDLSTYNTGLRIGSMDWGNTSAAANEEMSRNQIIFSGHRDIVQDSIGAKIAGINYRHTGGGSNYTDYTDLAFFTGAANNSGDNTVERMRIMHSTGNVGIGTTNPYAASLHVNKASVGGVGGAMILTNSGTVTVGNRTRLGFDLMGFDDIVTTAAIDSKLTNVNGETQLVFNTYDGVNVPSGDINYARMVITGTGNVGIGTTSPVSTLDVSGSLGLKVAAKTSDYTAASESIILVNATSGAVIITLPVAANSTNRMYIIKKTDSSANTVTIDGNASETIDGELTQVIFSQYTAIMIICDGSNWHIL